MWPCSNKTLFKKKWAGFAPLLWLLYQEWTLGKQVEAMRPLFCFVLFLVIHGRDDEVFMFPYLLYNVFQMKSPHFQRSFQWKK